MAMEQALTFDHLQLLRQSHPALRLLAADHMPLVVSFLHHHFVATNRRSIPQPDLAAALDDYLHHLRALHGEGLFPKPGRHYLDDWADGPAPFLRKFYPAQGGDEALFDLTPGSEKAIEWLRDLQAREFVGTESRLLTVFQLLREMVRESEQDPEARIAELERQKAELDQEIERTRAGRIRLLDPTQVRERFFQAEDTARKLLADFRQVEHNFRDLDKRTRERIALSDRPKGAMLDEVFAGHDEIRDSDQGRSFRAFWEFLMSPDRQQELDELLEGVFGLEHVRGVSPGDFLKRIRWFLLEAGEQVQRTNNQLVEQLRRYLDDQAWLENRRILDLIRQIERNAVALRDQAPGERDFIALDDTRPEVELPLSRTLFEPPQPVRLDSGEVVQGIADVAVEALFQQVYIDEEQLAANIRRLLQRRDQISLAEVVQRCPVQRGVAELVGYLSIAARDPNALFESEREDILAFDLDGQRRRVRTPRVIFTRGGLAAPSSADSAQSHDH